MFFDKDLMPCEALNVTGMVLDTQLTPTYVEGTLAYSRRQ